MSGRVDAAVVWNPWISQIQKSGTGRSLFTSTQMPGLIPDLLVANTRAIQNKQKDLVGMIRAWFDTEAFIRSEPDQAVAIMAKVVGMDPQQYHVFLPGTRFFLLSNKLIEGHPDAERGVDRTLLDAALTP
jgi:NitT/TauT family transport system substrate-binding protein